MSVGMKTVGYTKAALRDLRRFGNMADRIREAVAEYAAETGAHSNNIKPMKGGSADARRLRVGDFRAVFEETDTEITVTAVGPRGDNYETMTVQFIKAPGGARLAVLPAEEYEDLIDARNHAVAMAAVRAGSMETFTDAEVGEYLAAPSPLAFFRTRRGLTQAALAKAAGISQPYLAQIEGGDRTGTLETFAALARVLGVTIDDLVMNYSRQASGALA